MLPLCYVKCNLSVARVGGTARGLAGAFQCSGAAQGGSWRAFHTCDCHQEGCPRPAHLLNPAGLEGSREVNRKLKRKGAGDGLDPAAPSKAPAQAEDTEMTSPPSLLSFMSLSRKSFCGGEALGTARCARSHRGEGISPAVLPPTRPQQKARIVAPGRCAPKPLKNAEQGGDRWEHPPDAWALSSPRRKLSAPRDWPRCRWHRAQSAH